MNKPAARPKRKSIRQGGKLHFEARPGFCRRVVNDIDGRIADFEADGWKPVTMPTAGSELQAGDATRSGSVVHKPVGGGIDGFLMEIPKEWYDEDQQAKEAKRLSRETALLSEAPELSSGDAISIKRPGVTIE